MQVAFQALSKRIEDENVKVSIVGDEESLLGYVAYDGHIAATFRLTSEDWPPRDEVPEEIDIPEDMLAVFEPDREKRNEPVFRSLEDYLENFSIDDYEEGHDVFLQLKI